MHVAAVCNAYINVSGPLCGQHSLCIVERGIDGLFKRERFSTCQLVSCQDAHRCIARRVQAECWDVLCVYRRTFALPDVMEEQRAVLLYFAQLCDATLLEALDHHF
jgi:hypothetical protein